LAAQPQGRSAVSVQALRREHAKPAAAKLDA
jgi:hypothetical protein